MRKLILAGAAVALSAGIAAGPATAEPGGCLKYGAAGAVGGHLANHHGVLGAAGGCATGMYVRHKHRQEMREQQRMQQQGSAAPATSPATPR